MRDENGRSRCFGFVCFDSSESALKAKDEKHNKIHGSKPLYVALAQRKEDRQAFLATRFMRQINNMRMQQGQTVAGPVYTPAAGGYFMTPTVQGQAFMASSIPAQMRSVAPRWSKLSDLYYRILDQMNGYPMPNQSFQIRGPTRPLNKRPPNARGAGVHVQNRLPVILFGHLISD